MNDKLVTLDANILVYAVDIEAGKRHQRAIEIIERVRFLDCVLTLQALSEFFAVVIRKKKMPIDEAIAQFNDLDSNNNLLALGVQSFSFGRTPPKLKLWTPTTICWHLESKASALGGHLQS